MIRICSEVRISDIDTTPTFDKRAFENRLVDAFVKYHLNNGANYEFVCRPDEKHKGSLSLPDFEYCCRDNKILLIELKAITYLQSTSYMSLKDSFLILCKELEQKVSGTFYMMVPYQKILQERTGTSKNKKNFFLNIKEEILKKTTDLKQGESIDINSVLKILKMGNDGSSIHFFSSNLSPYWTKDVSRMIELLKKVGEKFNNYKKNLSKNILIFLHKGLQSTCNDVEIVIEDIESGRYDENHRTLPVFSGLYEIFVIPINIDWNRVIPVCRCYPHPKSAILCTKSQLFRDETELFYFLKEYFPG